MASIRGLFITFEGIDGCGKSTQARNAAARLGAEGVDVLLTREPGGTPIAERVRALILDPQHGEMVDECEVLLYLAARAQHVGERIKPAIESGVTVLCDRFSEATFAYQGYGRGMALDRLRSMNAFATGGLMPDHTFVFDITVDQALARMAAAGKAPDRLERNPREFHERIRQGYLAMAAAEPSRFTVLDGTQTVETLGSDVGARIVDMLKRARLRD